MAERPPPPPPPPLATTASSFPPAATSNSSSSPRPAPPDLNDSNPDSPQRSPSPTPQHRRGYQACDPCRKRKVKCDLGSVDNPRPPPCVRCRRESKRCEFSATRRKRKMADDPEPKEPTGVLRRDKRMMSAEGALASGDSTDNNSKTNGVTSYSRPAVPPYDAGSRASTQSQWGDASATVSHRLSIPSSSQPYVPPAPTSVPSEQYPRHRASFSGAGRPSLLPHGIDSGQHMMNKTAADLLSPAISNTHDALHLLSEAAGRTEDLNRQRLELQYRQRQASTSTFTSSVSNMGQGNNNTSGKASRSNSSTQKGGPMNWYKRRKGSSAVEPVAEGQEAVTSPKALDDSEYTNARTVWSRLRFVRAGWFSVDEAMAYIAYYYEHLAPLGPIVLQNFSSPSTHVTLLTEEPVLTVTMLTIASRHMKLAGNGAYSRAYSIHEKLWSYLRGMIERLIWGQEKFGSTGSPSAGPRQFSLTSPTLASANLNGNLRSLGTIEALLLLTDWHPRALHFPPGDDENTLLDMDFQLFNDKEEEPEPDHGAGKGQNASGEGRLAFYKWLEPVWRSDRMSWMLLSTAQALAFELGIFDPDNAAKPATGSPAELARKRRLRRLILVYVSQSSGRLGIPSMLPLPDWNRNTEPIIADKFQSPQSKEDYEIDMMQDCWMDITKIMYQSNKYLFPDKEHTSNLIKSGKYRDQIDEFIPSLKEFKQKIDTVPMSPQMHYILTIEYEYTRLYVNCLALQAVVERWTTMSNESASSGAQNQSATPSGSAPLSILLQQYEENEPYIQEVVDASRKILQIVLDGLVPGELLKHAPVRTFFRILSGMIFILKTFTLGAKENDVRVSLELQDRTIESLRTCIVDDVHLSTTVADLMQLLTTNIRTRFLRFAPFERAENCNSREQTPPPSAQPSPNPTHSDYRWQNNGGHVPGSFQFEGSNNASSTTPASTSDPLANIPAQPINSTNLNVSFMPPPPSVYYNYYDSTSPKMDLDDSTVAPQAISNGGANGQSGSSNTMSDWFALPLDQFFNSSTAHVDQGLGGTGPMVGEFDMLEVLLNEQYTDGGGNATSNANLPSQFL